jgi:hypothetical protein
LAPSMPTGPPAGNTGPPRTPLELPQPSHPRPSEMTLLQARAEQARIRLEAFTAGPVAIMRRDMAQWVARQSLSRVEAVDAARSSWPPIHVPSILPSVEEEKSYGGGWQQDVSRAVWSHDVGGPRVIDERKESDMEKQCTLEHVLAYLNYLCNEGKKISTVNRRLSSITKHILPGLFTRTVVPGSRQEQMMREVEAVIKGMRRTVGAEHRVRGKKPLLIENIREMVDVAAKAVDEDGYAMPNKRCRDVALLLFLWHSAMRRNEVVRLRWTDLTFDKRGVLVLIRQSKTDKESKGQTIAIPRLEGAHCCVTALEAWREKSGGVGESPVFRWISKKDEVQ